MGGDGHTSTPVVLPEHLSLLRQFGRSRFQRTLAPAQREEFWRETCKKGQIPHVPLAAVTEAWRRFVAGQSEHSGLALNGEIDPSFVSVGVTYHRRIQAAHTAPARSLLKHLLLLYRQAFKDEELFLLEVLDLCREENQKEKTKNATDGKPSSPAI